MCEPYTFEEIIENGVKYVDKQTYETVMVLELSDKERLSAQPIYDEEDISWTPAVVGFRYSAPVLFEGVVYSVDCIGTKTWLCAYTSEKEIRVINNPHTLDYNLMKE